MKQNSLTPALRHVGQWSICRFKNSPVLQTPEIYKSFVDLRCYQYRGLYTMDKTPVLVTSEFYNLVSQPSSLPLPLCMCLSVWLIKSGVGKSGQFNWVEKNSRVDNTRDFLNPRNDHWLIWGRASVRELGFADYL